MKWRLVASVMAVLGASGAGFGKTEWTPVGEGRLEIRSPDLQSPKEDVSAVVPLRHTEVTIQVRGFVAEVTVKQEFENPLERAIEAEYVFPLPEDAAVNATEMHVGTRVIRGHIDRREEARKRYKEARDQGKRASLLEQERPNIFTQSVASIGPKEKIDVMLRYVQTLPYRDGAYQVVYPMVVGPRYIPGVANGDGASGGASGHGRVAGTGQVPDAARITPPVLKPGERCGYDIGLKVDIDAGMPIRAMRSRAHQIDEKRDGENKAAVSLAAGERIPNKDFVLEIEVAGEQPEVGVLAHHDGKSGYFTLLFQPPKVPESAEIRPREILCVMDCSGSMSGQPLEISKKAASKLVASLRPTDRFNVIYFNMHAEMFQAAAVPATRENVQAGVGFIRHLQASGGTEMLTGIRASLGAPLPEGYMRMAVLFTDGYIGNEAAILREEQSLLGAARFFGFGVGSSVNRYLLDRMAVVGRGLAECVLLKDDPEEVIRRFVERMDKPVLTDVSVNFAGLAVKDVVPVPLPDVYAGAPIYLYGRYEQPGEADVEVVGRVGARPVATKVHVVLPAAGGAHSPLPAIWARQQIKDLEIAQVAGKSVAEQITKLALEYELMSAYTSFVAVDETPGPAGGKPQMVPVSVPMPEGVSYETTVGGAPGAYGGGGGGGGGGGSGGGPIGPFGVAGIGVLALLEWRRRRRAAK